MEPITLGLLTVWNHSVPEARARVLLIHGLSEHSGRHLNTINWLNENRIDVVRFDLRGAGKSGGRRQWIDSFQNYMIINYFTSKENYKFNIYQLLHT